ncbi:transcriptional regulator [Xylophilus rhododendri]|uniref:Transcriptional regulator n=2 Tax=Xylophilus rhododendri TaxID=2697032 RepID=A0A857JF49_9BURK|nr:transcriptional regulator [Xylophilus rhododendri]
MADFLDSPEAMTEYLSQVLADGNASELLAALGHVARAKNKIERRAPSQSVIP